MVREPTKGLASNHWTWLDRIIHSIVVVSCYDYTVSLKGLDYEPRIYTNWVDTCVALMIFQGESQGAGSLRLIQMGDYYVTVSR